MRNLPESSLAACNTLANTSLCAPAVARVTGNQVPHRSLIIALEGFRINTHSYEGPHNIEAELPVGAVVQLNVTGAHETHPLHLHTNAFQLVSLPPALIAHASSPLWPHHLYMLALPS